ncbi:MAG TPA: signal peptidase I [Pseudorhodoplanes sp.]|jgi:signal peptidase I|nr:signal peptidase I [Pseudorhodoplanes sp.]
MDQSSFWRRRVKPVVDLLAIVALITAAKVAVAEPYYVPSGSMEPTLLIGDELIATKYPYGYSSASLPVSLVLPQTKRFFGSLPERGDVVVFRYPGDRTQVWVKRVIGLPGDVVELREGRTFINGVELPLRADGQGTTEGVAARRFIETLPGGREHWIFKTDAANMFDNMKPVQVPADHVFVLGDNRDHSADSRVPLAMGGVGMLPVPDLIGRVDALAGSWNPDVRDQPLWTWPAGLRLARFFKAVR